MKKRKIKPNLSLVVTDDKTKFLMKFTKCGLCDNFLTPYNSNIDHIIPKSKGGANHSKNRQLTHVRCNKKKGNVSHVKSDSYVDVNKLMRMADLGNNDKRKFFMKLFDVKNLEELKFEVISIKDFELLKEIFRVYRIAFKEELKPIILPENQIIKPIKLDFKFGEVFIARYLTDLLFKEFSV